MNTDQDLLVKKAVFIDKVHSLKQEFGYASPRIICELVRIHATSFYGSMLWQLNSHEHLKLVRSWNTAIKIIWNLPYQTHTTFVEPLTNCPHLQAMLHSRYVGFSKSLYLSKKNHVRLLFSAIHNDVSSLTGSNINFLKSKYNVNSLEELTDAKNIIEKEKFKEMAPEDTWKIQVLEELINFRDEHEETELTKEEVNELLTFVTTS